MSNFTEKQEQLVAARKERSLASRATFLANEHLKKTVREKQKIERAHGRNSTTYQQIKARENEQARLLADEKARLNGAINIELGALATFVPLTDPREQVGQLSDSTPLLMFPLRMETRFKTVAGGHGIPQHQLWVRVFPDECSIDTFDDILSEAEINKARRYWLDIWKAGVAGNEEVAAYIEQKRRGAWRDLMGLFKAGRASWVETNYEPVNKDDIPTRHNESDIILVIPTEELPTIAIQDALRTFWIAYLQANGDAEQIDNALSALVSTLGDDDAAREQAAILIETHKPDNLDKIEFDPELALDILLVFLHFPRSADFDSKLAAWSQAAKVTTLPERLVLLGYQKDQPEPILQEVGHLIPDPLIVGPDPGEDINETLEQVFGEEFDSWSDDIKAEKYIEYLSTQAATKWLFNFDEAINKGMGFKVNIDGDIFNNGIHRLFVLGVKLSADKNEAKTLLEQLIKNHHLGESGFAILPQGSATNNTENSPSAYSLTEDPDEAYARYHSDDEPVDPAEKEDKRDGRWLVDLLGIDRKLSSIEHVSGYDDTDQCEARAMNTALWNATIGYFMESMLTPVFSEAQRDMTRRYLINYVSGRGRLPAIRIGDQPYGILPVSKVSDLRWIRDKRTPFRRQYAQYFQFLRDAYPIMQTMQSDWSAMLSRVAYVGKDGEDSQETVLQALGLHANSVEFDQRYAESFEHLFNRLNSEGFTGSIKAWYIALLYNPAGMALLAKLGYVHDQELNPEIPILSKYFLTKENDVTKPLIDDQELSETEKIKIYTEAEQNYIEWLIENARDNHQNIKDQKGFLDNKPPYALLYDMLRHALNLEFGNTGLNLYANAEIITPAQKRAARIDSPFIGVEAQAQGLQSKWDLLYRQDSRITNSDILIAEHVSGLLKANVINSQTRHLHEIISALEKLKGTPTAKLERAFVEHLDLCTYRLDAWLLGLVNLQLHAMRYGSEDNDDEPTQGIYLGAYGWLQDLKPDNKILTEPELPADLEEIFNPDGASKPMRDSTNAGYIHAPSIDHGITAAVLRNAYISNASQDDAEVYKVNLSSERVRLAMSIVEGMQQGQSLAALLGYQLERGLHDNNDYEMDSYIYELRKVFPLNSNRLKKTLIKADKVAQSASDELRIQEEEEEFEDDKAVTKIEARNVVNGLALLDHIRKTNKENYPFGLPVGTGIDKLKPADPDVSDAIDKEVHRLMNIRDAVADLAISEGVHQVVQGNYERGSAALESYSKGNYPPLPEVAKSHNAGIGLTHRFGVHLQAGVIPDGADNPRVKMEPAINQWLVDLFPDLAEIVCHVEYKIPDYDAVINLPVGKDVTLADIGLAPIDILYMLNIESDKSLTALDDYILKHVYTEDAPRPDVEMQVHYTRHTDGRISYFELSPLIDNLRTLILKSRPLKATDIGLQNEAAEGEVRDITSSINIGRIEQANSDVAAFIPLLTGDVLNILTPLIDLEDFENTLSNEAAILGHLDLIIANYINHLSGLNHFGLPETGFGYVYDRKATIYKAIYKKVLEQKQRWDEKDIKYGDLINNQLPAATTDEERIAILQEAERTISTSASIPIPAIPTYLTHLANIKTAFDEKTIEMQTFLGNNIPMLIDLITAVKSINTGLENHVFTLIDIEQEVRQALVLAEDIYKHSIALTDKLAEVNTVVTNLVSDAKEKADVDVINKLLDEAVKTIFGQDFIVIPEFTLATEQATELQQCFNSRQQLIDYQKTTLANDFPVDDWLYGIARVREKLAAWENMVMLAEGIKNRDSIDLTALQLPYMEDDHWLALSYPQDHVIDSDKLLYTAYMANFDSMLTQCGLMIDEWTEVIPHKNETTGLCFHYDQPNSEPPQAMLLMTPSVFTGQWRWSDLVDTLHDTLDLAQMRAIEPDHLDLSPYAKFLPATVAATTTYPVTMALNYLLQSGVMFMNEGEING